MRRLANVSLGNRALIALITVFVMIFGVITARDLKQELIPSITIPTAFIITTYPGASPQVVEESVTSPIEQAVLGLADLESSTSTSSTGSSLVNVNMRYGVNMSTVQQDLQASISRIEGILPEEADSQVITGSFDDLPVLVMSVDDSGSAEDLSKRLGDIGVPELEKIDGVRSVQVSGAPVRQVEISLNMKKLEDEGLTVANVTQAVQTGGGLVSGGTLAQGKNSLAVTIGERFTTPSDVGDLAMAVSETGDPKTVVGPDGVPQVTPGKTSVKVVKISEVAKVREVNATSTSISRTNGKPSLTMAITKTPDGNTVAVSEGITEALPALSDKLGNDVKFTTVFDQAPFITESIRDLLVEGGLGLVMAIVVILVFLLSIRSTIVTAISIPVSVLMALIGLSVGGFTLNILTLGALTISIGRVVDDSIVVIENIKRHLSYGEDKIHAIKTAVGEVATAITAATLTTVAVFLPIGLVGGQTGELFRPFAFTVGFALLSSLAVSLTIVPVLAYWFLKSPSGSVDADTVRTEAMAKERRSILQRVYVPTLRAAIFHPVVSLLLAVAVLGGTLALAPQLKTNFLGDSGQNTVSVTQSYPPALSLDEQASRAEKVETELRGVSGVTAVQSTVGSAGGAQGAFGFGGTSDAATFSLTTDQDVDQVDLQNRLRKAVDKYSSDGEISVTGNAQQGGSTVEVVVSAPDTTKLRQAADQVLKAMRDVPGTSDVNSSLAADQPQIQVEVDAAKAAKEGLNDQSVAQALRGVLSPATVGQVEKPGGSTIDIVLKTGRAPVGMRELRNIKLLTPSGDKVKVSKVAAVTRTDVATSIAHNDGQRSATISLTPTGDNLGAVSTAVDEELSGVKLANGVDAKVGGVAAEQADAFGQLGLALLVAIAIVYVIMVATFKSLIQPLILTVSVPFATTGALVALLISDTALGVPSLIGMLMLVGIVVTNAIVLIDLVNHYRLGGQSIDDALINGARQRLRPILMTALATVMALVPMALGISGGGVFISKPLAIVVIGGLVSSTLLTLLLVPVLYRLVERGKERRADKRVAKRGEGGTGGFAETAGDAGASGSAEAEAAPEHGEFDPRPKHALPAEEAPSADAGGQAKPRHLLRRFPRGGKAHRPGGRWP